MGESASCAARVERLRGLMAERGYDAVIVRNIPDLRWLTGAERTFDDEVAHTSLVTADGLWLHTDSRYYNALAERLDPAQGWVLDQDVVAPAQWAARRVAEARARVVAVEDTCDLAFFDAFGEACSHASVACLTPRLHGDLRRLRIVKDAGELGLMRRAQEVTDEAFAHICDFMRPGLTELEVRAELEGYMLSHGADALSFPSIVASGPNGANPHAQPGERRLEEGDLVVMDYGAAVRDYHSDMTRTVCVGAPTDEQRRVFDVVRRAHEECARALRPGCVGSEVHALAVRVISEAGYGDCFGHGLGHGVGLEIHEWPSLGRAWDEPVPAGSVVTVEPGIYLPGRFGIRLEDFGVVGEGGFEPFTRSTHDLVCVGA